MHQYEYQRPREKLRLHGASSLTVAELLQLIISSGGAHRSAARIAREVEQLVRSQDLSYDALKSIKGMGEAKICQVLAAFELARKGTGAISS